jgi:hypothetical protein
MKSNLKVRDAAADNALNNKQVTAVAVPVHGLDADGPCGRARKVPCQSVSREELAFRYLVKLVYCMRHSVLYMREYSLQSSLFIAVARISSYRINTQKMKHARHLISAVRSTAVACCRCFLARVALPWIVKTQAAE